jgi:hypothetical protein
MLRWLKTGSQSWLVHNPKWTPRNAEFSIQQLNNVILNGSCDVWRKIGQIGLNDLVGQTVRPIIFFDSHMGGS